MTYTAKQVIQSFSSACAAGVKATDVFRSFIGFSKLSTIKDGATMEAGYKTILASPAYKDLAKQGQDAMRSLMTQCRKEAGYTVSKGKGEKKILPAVAKVAAATTKAKTPVARPVATPAKEEKTDISSDIQAVRRVADLAASFLASDLRADFGACIAMLLDNLKMRDAALANLAKNGTKSKK